MATTLRCLGFVVVCWLGSCADGPVVWWLWVLRWLGFCGGSCSAVARALRWLTVARVCGASALRWLGSAWNDLLIKGGWVVGSVGDGSGSAVARALWWLGLCGGLRWLASAVARFCGGSGLRWLGLCGGSGSAVARALRWFGRWLIVARALRWLGSVWNDL